MDDVLLFWIMIAIVGTVGVVHNYIEFGGKKFWTTISLVVGVLVGIAALYLPLKALQVWVGVTGATLFYDTIIKFLQKKIEKFADSGTVSER